MTVSLSGMSPHANNDNENGGGGGDIHARTTRNEIEYNDILEQIQREDEEIIAIVLSAIETGVI